METWILYFTKLLLAIEFNHRSKSKHMKNSFSILNTYDQIYPIDLIRKL